MRGESYNELKKKFQKYKCYENAKKKQITGTSGRVQRVHDFRQLNRPFGIATNKWKHSQMYWLK